MAMNKRERDEFEVLRQERDMFRAWALGIGTRIKPDLAPPKQHNEVVLGWVYNEYCAREGRMYGAVTKAAVNYAYHRVGDDAWKNANASGGWSQRTPHVYSSRSLALKACRYEVARQAAIALSVIDKHIEKAITEELEQ